MIVPSLGARETTFDAQQLTRVQEIIKLLTFVGCEASAALVQIGVYTLLDVTTGWTYWQKYLPALIASVLWSFTANRKFTFKSVSNIPLAMLKVTIYYTIFTPVSTWWGDALAAQHWVISPQAQGYVILIGTMLVNFVTEFCVYRFWVYPHSINSSAAGQREQSRYESVGEPDLVVS